MSKRLLTVGILAFAAMFPAFPLTLSDLDANAGLILIGSPSSPDTASPIVASFGASLPIGVAEPFFLEPVIDFYGLYYVYDGARALPCALENAAGFFTVASLVSLQAGVRFDLAPALSCGGAVGCDFLLRLPLEWENTSAESVAGSSAATGYFYSGGRFFYPETGVFLRWQAVDGMALVFSIRAFYPIFHLWDGEGQPFFDQFMLSGMVGFAFALNNPQNSPK